MKISPYHFPNRLALKASFAALLFLVSEPVVLRAGESLTFADAVARALEKSPSLAAYSSDIRIAEARTIRALAIPKPELESEVEDVLGDGQYEGFRSAIYNVGVSQLIETGKKRELRGNVARAESEVSLLRFEVAKRELIREVGKRFVAVLAAQQAEVLAGENHRIAGDVLDTIEAQIKEGRGSAIDSGQALIAKNEARLAYDSASLRKQLAQQQLSALWASPEPDFGRVAGGLEVPSSSYPSLKELKGAISDHPSVALARAGVDAASAQLSLEQKKRIPDVTVGVGYRRDDELNDNAMVLGFSLPLPLFNKNEGGIAEAEATIERSQALVAAAETQLQLQIASGRAQMEAALAAYNLVVDKMLPAASKHYGTLKEGYGLGRIKYLELLEGRRSLNSVKKQKIEALSAYHVARAEVEALTGKRGAR